MAGQSINKIVYADQPVDVLAEQLDQSQSVGITTLEDTSEAVEELAAGQKALEIQENSQAQRDTVATPPSSWWDYVGWSGTQPKETTQLPSISIDPATPMERADSDGTEFLSAVSPESPVVVSDTPSPPSPSPPSLRESDADDTTKPASITSAEGQSSWLNPWNWYSGSTATPSSLRPSLPPVEENDRELTESQMIIQAALARDNQSSPTATQPPAPVLETDTVMDTVKDDGKAYPDEVNPIRSTVGANRSGWASFFLARSIKSIEDGEKRLIGTETGNGEMEVMEVPDPEDLPPEVTATATTTTTAAPAIPTSTPGNTMAAIVSQFVPKSSAVSIKSSSSKVPTSPVRPPKELEKELGRREKEPKKKDPPATPLTNSEKVKETTRKTAERSSSPSPSKRSGTSTPVSPRNEPPNLVLPTWGDTFHAPPRSLLPISMIRKEDEYVVTKTIKTLWSRGWEVAGMGNAKGKERAGIQGESGKAGHSELADFGKSLPRALNVVGERMDPKMLQGVCRVVVIGIAGWSPGAVTRTIAGGVSLLSSADSTTPNYSSLIPHGLGAVAIV